VGVDFVFCCGSGVGFYFGLRIICTIWTLHWYVCLIPKCWVFC
jgi:hypothetical protein